MQGFTTRVIEFFGYEEAYANLSRNPRDPPDDEVPVLLNPEDMITLPR